MNQTTEKNAINKSDILVPDFESLDKMLYTELSSALRPFNQRIIEELRESLSGIEHPYPQSGIAYFLPGSHAREENFISPIELTLLHEDGLAVSDDYRDETKYLLDQDFPGMMYPQHITLNAGINYEDRIPRIQVSGGSEVSPFPIMLEAASLYDPSELLEKTRDSLLTKLRTPLGRKSMQRHNHQNSKISRIVKTGYDIFKKEKVNHVDYDAGVSFFSKKNERGIRQESFKPGPLRLVQYRLARDFMARIRDKEKIDVPLSEMPANISDRLFYLRDNELTSGPVAESLADHYQYFLWQHYRSVSNHYRTGSQETQFDRAEVRERRQELMDLTAKPLF